MLISSLFFSMMAFLLKLLYINSEVTTYEVTYWQSLIMIFLNMVLFRVYKKDHMEVPKGLRNTIILRGFTGFVGMSGFYLALEFTDLSKATALYWTNPMITALISSCMLHEILTFLDWLAIFVSFAGIIVIENPWTISTLIETTSETVSTQSLIGSSAAIIGAVFFAVSQMQTRKLGKRVHFLVPPFYQAIVSAFIAPLLMFIMLRYRTTETTTYGIYELGMVVLISLSMFVAQIF
jgi:drug/metabolite transporter (DMT)-like permease